jgi:hypothetical protein
MDSHRPRRIGLLAAAAALFTLNIAAPARPEDAVTDWNQRATEALIGTAGQSPPVSAVHLAMVHGAVYDAVNAIDRRYEPYLGAPEARPWYSKDAAAATAAHRVLISLVPAQQPTLDGHYLASLAGIPDGRAKDGGVAVGEAAAKAMIDARSNDGRFGAFRFAVGTEPGQWRPVLPAFVNDPNAWLAFVQPFLIESPSQLRSRGPNPLTSRKYAREFDEVKSLGSLTSTTRTADQTDAARFWSEGTAAWFRVSRALSKASDLRIADNARLFGMLYLTTADAAISCWNDKAYWWFWRPIAAIREADTDGNPATEPDPEWLPLINNPPYPDHPSGLACLSSAIARTLRDFFRTDRVEFSATSTASGTTRSYTRFSQAVDEIVDARVWSGLHFRAADEQGAKIGKQVARYRKAHYFEREHRSDDEDDFDREDDVDRDD